MSYNEPRKLDKKTFGGFYYVCAKKKFNNPIKHNRNYL